MHVEAKIAGNYGHLNASASIPPEQSLAQQPRMPNADDARRSLMFHSTSYFFRAALRSTEAWRGRAQVAPRRGRELLGSGLLRTGLGFAATKLVFGVGISDCVLHLGWVRGIHEVFGQVAPCNAL